MVEAQHLDYEFSYGSRGEDLVYRVGSRSLLIGFSSHERSTLYPWSLSKWDDGEPLTPDELRMALDRAITFVRSQRQKPALLIKKDDPHYEIWREVAARRADDLHAVEYTTTAEQHEQLKESIKPAFGAGDVVIDGRLAKTESELDAVWPAAFTEPREVVIRSAFKVRYAHYRNTIRGIEWRLRVRQLIGKSAGPRIERQVISLIETMTADLPHDTPAERAQLRALVNKFPRFALTARMQSGSEALFH